MTVTAKVTFLPSGSDPTSWPFTAPVAGSVVVKTAVAVGAAFGGAAETVWAVATGWAGMPMVEAPGESISRRAAASSIQPTGEWAHPRSSAASREANIGVTTFRTSVVMLDGAGLDTADERTVSSADGAAGATGADAGDGVSGAVSAAEVGRPRVVCAVAEVAGFLVAGATGV